MVFRVFCHCWGFSLLIPCLKDLKACLVVTKVVLKVRVGQHLNASPAQLMALEGRGKHDMLYCTRQQGNTQLTGEWTQTYLSREHWRPNTALRVPSHEKDHTVQSLKSHWETQKDLPHPKLGNWHCSGASILRSHKHWACEWLQQLVVNMVPLLSVEGETWKDSLIDHVPMTLKWSAGWKSMEIYSADLSFGFHRLPAFCDEGAASPGWSHCRCHDLGFWKKYVAAANHRIQHTSTLVKSKHIETYRNLSNHWSSWSSWSSLKFMKCSFCKHIIIFWHILLALLLALRMQTCPW